MINNHQFWTLLKPCLVAVVIAAMGPSDVWGQESEKLTGAWKITVEAGDRKVQSVVFVLQDESKLKIKESASGKTAEGSVKDGKVRFTLTQDRDGQELAFSFSGSLEGKKMSGKGTFGDQEFHWSGAPVQSVYFCGNHQNPKHAADSNEMMEELHKHSAAKTGRRSGVKRRLPKSIARSRPSHTWQ